MKKILIYIILPILLAACADEQYELTVPDAPDGMVSLAIDLTTADFDKPTKTRAALTDSDIKNAWAIVFENPSASSYSKDATVREVVNVTLSADGKSGKCVMTASTRPTFMMLIGNTSLKRSTSISKGMSYESVINNELFYGDPTANGENLLSIPQTTLLFSNDAGELITPIPMSGISQILPKVDVSTKFNNAIRMARIVNKLYVNAVPANTKNGFVLNGVSLLGTHVSTPFDLGGVLGIKPAQHAPATDLYKTDGTTKDVILKNITDNTTKSASTDRPIYYYESYKPFDVILAGTPQGSASVRYYKANVNVTTSGNSSVMLNIQSVNNNGYATMEAAIAAPAGSGIVVEAVILDATHEIIANGQYYLGVTNSEFQLYDSGVSDIETVTTVTTNAYSGVGVPPASSVELITSNGVSLVSGSTITANSTELKVEFLQDKCDALIRVKIGDLVKDITIKKDVTVPPRTKIKDPKFLSDKIVVAEILNGSNIAISENDVAPVAVDKIEAADKVNGTQLYVLQTLQQDMPEATIRGYKTDGSTVIIKLRYILGWAGCNIYWDDVRKQLTFDAVPEKNTTGPNVQKKGLFFKWSSLVALGEIDFRRFEPLFSPSGKSYQTIYASENAREIPVLDAKSDNANQLLRAHDPVNDFGDICKYMTDRGWAPPGEWRMPSASDYRSILEDGITVSTGNNVNMNSPYGTVESKEYALFGSLLFPGTQHFVIVGAGSGTSAVPEAAMHMFSSSNDLVSLSSISFRGRTIDLSPIRCVKYK